MKKTRCNGFDRLMGPRLHKLIETYEVFLSSHCGILAVSARASDGQIVLLANLYDKESSDNLEFYLQDHPTPDTW